MNHNELIQKISQRTGIAPSQCDEVLRAFEEIASEELSERPWKGRLLDTLLRILTAIRDRKGTSVAG